MTEPPPASIPNQNKIQEMMVKACKDLEERKRQNVTIYLF